MRVFLLRAILLSLPLASPVTADELSDLRERVAQLEATVEELTLQLADSVRERRQLEARLAEAVAAAGAAVAAPATLAPEAASTSAEPATEVITETAVSAAAAPAPGAAAAAPTAPTAGADSAYIRSADCDVAQALAGYNGKREGNEALEAWLQADDHLERCSTAQLQAIRDAVKWDWLGYEKPVLRLLDKELARR